MRGLDPAAALLGVLVAVQVPAGAQQHCDADAYPLSAPSARFEDNADGTVTDRGTQLMWTRCSAGQRWVAGACSGVPQAHDWASAQAYAVAVNEGGDFFYKDWRMPQLRELATISERQCSNPRVNIAVFPQTPAEYYWTGSVRPVADGASRAFALSFGPEGVEYRMKTAAHHVRLVRNAR